MAGLLFARAAARETEPAIRWALGATADRLARQMPLETLLVAAAVFTAIVAGVGPTLGAVRGQTPRLLAAGRGSGSMRQSRIRRWVVVAQVTLATALRAGAGLLGKSLLGLRAVLPVFDPRDVVTARVMLTGPRYAKAPARARFYADVLERLRALPDVRAAGATDLLLVRGVVLGVAVLARWIAARRAASTAPANALRAE